MTDGTQTGARGTERSRASYRVRTRCAAVACLAALLAARSGAAVADDPTSIEQFNSQSRIWQQLVGTRLTLEGRCAGLSAERLLMTRCELIFEFAEGVVVPRNAKNVVVTGELVERGARLVFVVSRVQGMPGDLEHLRRERGRIDVNRADEWYALADWARQRAAFYQDEALDTEATDLYRQGVQAEYRRLPFDDSSGLVALAEKAARFGLSERLKMEFLHEAVSRELDAAAADERPRFNTVMTHARDWLPGARLPLLEYNDEIRERHAAYQQSRRETYAAAEDDERRVLERLLYIQAALRKIEGDAADDGRNGFDIAERIEDSIPEMEQLPEEYREREIRWQIDNVAGASREELLVLVDRLEERDREGESIDARRTWLKTRAERLNRVGVSGRLELAREYIDLLDDEDSAVEIYRELHRSPESQTIAAARLQDLGYTFDGTDWQRGAADDGPDELSMAIRNGSVRAGMTQSDVRAALGRPESTLRFASRGQVVELWVYPGPGVSIHFARKRPEAEQVAIDVFNLPAHTREQIRP